MNLDVILNSLPNDDQAVIQEFVSDREKVFALMNRLHWQMDPPRTAEAAGSRRAILIALQTLIEVVRSTLNGERKPKIDEEDDSIPRYEPRKNWE